jgi:hypothetical protein
MAKNVLTSVTELAKKIAEENDCYLYDAEYQKEGKNQILRIYIDKDGGISRTQKTPQTQTQKKTGNGLKKLSFLVGNDSFFHVKFQL